MNNKTCNKISMIKAVFVFSNYMIFYVKKTVIFWSSAFVKNKVRIKDTNLTLLPRDNKIKRILCYIHMMLQYYFFHSRVFVS